MKKTISLLLSLILILSLAACMSVKTPQTAKSEPEPVVTPEPTAVPTATPAPTEVPADVAIANATKKLAEVKSMHADMELTFDMELSLTMGETSQNMPMDINMTFAMDTTSDPEVTRMDVALSAMGENMNGVIYVAQEGENTVLYSSDDEGVTWKKQVNPKNASLPQSSQETLDTLVGPNAARFERTGAQEVNGQPATVYTGKVDGKLLQDVLNSTGAAGELTEAMGADLSAEELLSKLGDIDLTLMIDDATGMPVRLVVDMTNAMKDLMMASLLASMGADSAEALQSAGLSIDVTTVVLDLTMSQFDAVEPIVIPEAALAAEATEAE